MSASHPPDTKTHVVKSLIVRGIRKGISVNTEDLANVDVLAISVDLGVVGVECFVADTVHLLYPRAGAKSGHISTIRSTDISTAYSLATTVYTFVQSCPSIPRQTVSSGVKLSQFSSIVASFTRASW